MQSTVVFKLLTGVECESKRFMGLHQRILTADNGKATADKLDEILEDIVVRVGDVNYPKKDFFLKMLSEDKNKMLWEIRQASLPPEKRDTFDFSYEYTSVKPETKGKILKYELNVNLAEMGSKPYLDDAGNPVNFKTYDEVLKYARKSMVLPIAGTTVEWNLLNGEGEAIRAGEKAPSSHTLMEMRQPVQMIKKEKDTVPIILDLDRMEFYDIETLRGAMGKYEGKLESLVIFEHPEAALLKADKKTVRVSLLSQTAFFFPSEAI